VVSRELVRAVRCAEQVARALGYEGPGDACALDGAGAGEAHVGAEQEWLERLAYGSPQMREEVLEAMVARHPGSSAVERTCRHAIERGSAVTLRVAHRHGLEAARGVTAEVLDLCASAEAARALGEEPERAARIVARVRLGGEV